MLKYFITIITLKKVRIYGNSTVNRDANIIDGFLMEKFP